MNFTIIKPSSAPHSPFKHHQSKKIALPSRPPYALLQNPHKHLKQKENF